MESRVEVATAPLLVMAFNGQVLGIDAGTGEVRWATEVEVTSYACSLLVTATEIYACTVTTLVCLDYPSGSLRWKTGVPRGRGTLLLDGSQLYVATSKGEIDCYSLEGEHLWHNPLKGKGTGYVALGVPGNVMQADEDRS